MKKLFLLVLVIVMFACSVAQADPNPAAFLYGTWARIVEYDDHQLNIDMFHIFPDHRAYYVSRWFDGKEIDLSDDKIIEWSFEDGKFYLFFDAGYETFIPVDDFTLKTDESLPVLYMKIYPVRR